MLGVFFIGAGLDAFATYGLGTTLILLTMGVLPVWVALQLIASARQEQARQASQAVEDAERVILRVASRHGGRVTPALAVAEGRHLTVARAREVLEELAAEGLCTPEADDDGNLYYQFSVGGRTSGRATSEEDLSPEEWVEYMSGRRRTRLTGQEVDDQDLRIRE